MNPYRVFKFGGSSVANSSCFRQVAALVQNENHQPLAVVVSAMGGMTDQLLNLIGIAESGADDFRQPIAQIVSRYELATGALLAPGDRREAVLASFHADVQSLNDVLKAIALVRAAPERSQDLIAGYGEIWSSKLLAAYLGELTQNIAEIAWLDAREALTIRKSKLGPTVLWERSRERLQLALPKEFGGIVVITGFIAADEEGLHATLGRNGSDFSAAIFASLFEAESLTIWTDVDGVLSADPRRVPEAQIIRSVSYNEAMELAYFGAKVIHPQTMGPAISRDIPIFIRNTFAPDTDHTRIEQHSDRDQPIKGITAIDGIALVNVEGAGMIGVPGTADRLFSALHRADVSVILISQASSEHSICFAVPSDVVESAQRAVSDAFAVELAEGQIQRVDVTDDMSIVAVVGEGMSGLPGVAGKFLNTLGRAGINVAAIAQGSSERNISIVIRREDSTRALRAVHSGFYLSRKTLSIGLIGPGTVGATLIKQIAAQSESLKQRFNLDLRIRAISGSKKMLFAEREIDLTHWAEKLKSEGAATDIAALANHVHADHLPHAVIVDCTAEAAIAQHYTSWLKRGIHVVTPNKKAFSAPMNEYQALRQAATSTGAHCLYETTVGAGLPVINTLRDLIETGDRVQRVEGIFSGTLAYLFNTYDGSRAFSEIVKEARSQGFTEPDPRDDLSGMDVARKVTILAREAGMPIELADLDVQSLVPEALRDVDTQTFLDRLSEFDDDMEQLVKRASALGKCLRYVGVVDRDEGASVALVEFDLSHSFAQINLTDNVVQYVSERYSDNPLVVQGPGAGPDVTAAGVFADLLRLASYLSGTD